MCTQAVNEVKPFQLEQLNIKPKEGLQMENQEKFKNPIMQRMEGVGIGYYGVQRHIMSATHFVTKVETNDGPVGTPIEISLIDKVVLHYLIDQVGYSVGKHQRPLVASMTKIAIHLALNDRTVGRSVAKLIKHGLVKATKKSAAIGYEYHDLDVNQTFTNEVSAAVLERMKPNPINVKKTEPAPVNVESTFTGDFDEFDDSLPF